MLAWRLFLLTFFVAGTLLILLGGFQRESIFGYILFFSYTKLIITDLGFL